MYACWVKRHDAIAVACLPFFAGTGAAVAELEPLCLEPVTSWGMMMGCLEATRLSASRLLTLRQAMTLPYWLSCRQVSSFSTCMAISLRSTPCTSFLLQGTMKHHGLSSLYTSYRSNLHHQRRWTLCGKREYYASRHHTGSLCTQKRHGFQDVLYIVLNAAPLRDGSQ